MYTHNLNPIAFSIGSLDIRWYGIIFAIGFILFYLLLYYIAKKDLIENFNTKNLDVYFLYIIICVIVFSRVLDFVFYDFMTIIKNPLEVLMIWHGGLSFHGGLIGFIVGSLLFTRKKKIKIWKLLDISAVVAIFGLMLGRLGNFVNGELVGEAFTGSWCVVFPKYDAICRHPYQIYAFLSHLLLFIFLVYLLYMHRGKWKEYLGTKKLAINFLIGYGLLRIIVDFFKVDSVFWSIKTGQWLSIGMIVFGIILIWYNKRKHKSSNF